ncbi:short chain dehydrogenase [Chitinophaga parva]|uniref:Short chain dehydrogenase n=1 Tax=Chitinophaga parva TaxID=2169414 RepID=A0A2T7BEP0_9BACT|nr:short chain dehydrogenase [Chitinophaga parva]PUZ24744.1 short chain dehydrogenase [Chitinophaga parva]
MKIIIVGATGTLGKKVTESLKPYGHELIRVGSKSGDLQVDITDPASIEKLFAQTGRFDALVSVAGAGHFGPLQSMTIEDFKVGVASKLLGQVGLVLLGQHHIHPKGSFTLTSGILSEDPVRGGVNLSTVNGAVNSFAIAAATELQNDVRINAVSPGVVEDSPGFHATFPGHIPVTMDRVVAAYLKSILGAGSGQVIKVF